ncbi:MAG TPA: addiction module protein [Gemmataceae bacterium]|jgi:putative addiction module component (TIGR02574 family)|nr:addiction module protein [Gemmataceae bacterium]
MSSLFRSLGIDRLDVAERLALVHEIWESIAEDTAATPTRDDEKREIDRRCAAHEANPAAAISWAIVEAEALARLRQ